MFWFRMVAVEIVIKVRYEIYFEGWNYQDLQKDWLWDVSDRSGKFFWLEQLKIWNYHSLQ